MARLNIKTSDADEQTVVEVVLSRRNLLALLQKLDMKDSARTLMNNDTFKNGEQTNDTLLVLKCEDDDEHYAKRVAGPGILHQETESFVRDHGGKPGERFVPISVRVLPSDQRWTS